jgi:hypothetical protein
VISKMELPRQVGLHTPPSRSARRRPSALVPRGDMVATVDASTAFNLIYQESQTLLRMQESLG